MDRLKILPIMQVHFKKLFLVLLCLCLSGCINTTQFKNFFSFDEQSNLSKSNHINYSEKSVLQERVFKSRVLYCPDKKVMGFALISTLQDFGYQLEYTSSDYKLISGSKINNRFNNEKISVTITFDSRDDEFVLVRVSFTGAGINPITEERDYQNFFNHLSKSVFLRNNGVL